MASNGFDHGGHPSASSDSSTGMLTRSSVALSFLFRRVSANFSDMSLVWVLPASDANKAQLERELEMFMQMMGGDNAVTATEPTPPVASASVAFTAPEASFNSTSPGGPVSNHPAGTHASPAAQSSGPVKKMVGSYANLLPSTAPATRMRRFDVPDPHAVSVSNEPSSHAVSHLGTPYSVPLLLYCTSHTIVNYKSRV